MYLQNSLVGEVDQRFCLQKRWNGRLKNQALKEGAGNFTEEFNTEEVNVIWIHVVKCCGFVLLHTLI